MRQVAAGSVHSGAARAEAAQERRLEGRYLSRKRVADRVWQRGERAALHSYGLNRV